MGLDTWVWTDELVLEFATYGHLISIKDFKEAKQKSLDKKENTISIPFEGKKWEATKEPKQPLFTTSDNKPIYEGDVMCLLSTNNWLTSYPIPACKNPFAGDENQFKYFSTEEAAKEYILYHKPCLSLNDLVNICYGGGGGLIHNPFYNKAKELVKEKLK